MVYLEILHTTSYRYWGRVHLGAHRLMMQPREGNGLRVTNSEILTDPPATLSRAEDVYGNGVITAEFLDAADRLSITAVMEVELRDNSLAHCSRNVGFPLSYSAQELRDLGRLAGQRYPDPDGRVRNWAAGFIYSIPTEATALLGDLCLGVSNAVLYQGREEYGTQSPQQTLARGWGACRDLAVLFAEAARSLGFGARIVSGYVFDPTRPAIGAGATHAWAEIYLPDTGWKAFDPTNAGIGGIRLVPVAVGADISELPPVSGNFAALGAALRDMRVEVTVTQRLTVDG